MTKSLLVRLLVRFASALATIALAAVLVGLIPFLSAGPSAREGLIATTPAVTVNREFKGDLLPLAVPIDRVLSRQLSRPSHPASHEIPLGCEASFSPVSAPQLAYVYGRCMT